MKFVGRVGSAAMVMAILAGCRTMPPKKPVPPTPASVAPAPALVPTPIDPSLRAAARTELIQESNGMDVFLRCNAIEAISDQLPDDAPGPIFQALQDQAAPVRFAGAMAAGKLKLESAHNVLLAMAPDSDIRVQAAVRYALHRMGDTRYSHDLEKFSVNLDPRIRGTTAQVLGLLGEPSAIPILMRLRADSRPEVRIQASEALWELGDHQGMTDLLGDSISGYPDDQIIALLALAKPKVSDPSVIGTERGALTSDFPEVSLAAARAMGMLGSDEGWNVAVPYVTSNDPLRRSLAAMALGAIGRPDLQPYLLVLLKDSEPAVRISAATAILQVHEPGQ